MALRVVTLGIAIWALIVAYIALDRANYVQKENDNIIEKLMFK